MVVFMPWLIFLESDYWHIKKCSSTDGLNFYLQSYYYYLSHISCICIITVSRASRRKVLLSSSNFTSQPRHCSIPQQEQAVEVYCCSKNKCKSEDWLDLTVSYLKLSWQPLPQLSPCPWETCQILYWLSHSHMHILENVGQTSSLWKRNCGHIHLKAGFRARIWYILIFFNSFPRS